MPIQYYVYLVKTGDKTYYCGQTVNPQRRFQQHQRNRGSIYCRIHRATELRVIAEFSTLREALHYERTVKKLSHAKKEQLWYYNATYTIQ